MPGDSEFATQVCMPDTGEGNASRAPSLWGLGRKELCQAPLLVLYDGVLVCIPNFCLYKDIRAHTVTSS